MNMVGTALHVAWHAHAGQKDKGGNPYIQHPLYVASRMETENEIMTALMHDVVEDSDYTITVLKYMGFPGEVLDALELLTHDPDVDYFDYVRALKGNELARKVKLADLEHNSQIDRLGRKPTIKDIRRLRKYEKAKKILLEQATADAVEN